MPLEDYYQDKNIRYIILAILVVALIILIKDVLLKEEQLKVPEVAAFVPKVDINLELLENREIGKFLPFEELSLPEGLGRENPFSPY